MDLETPEQPVALAEETNSVTETSGEMPALQEENPTGGEPVSSESDETSSEFGEPEIESTAPSETSESEPERMVDIFIAESVSEDRSKEDSNSALRAVIEAAIYITDEPLSTEQIATATEQPLEKVKAILDQIVVEYAGPDRGLLVRELAGGYKMATKPEYHESIRKFVKRLQPPLKLSLAALETLAVVAYKQPITGPEILEIRGVQGAGVLKTLLDRKLIATAGRKNVLGKPMMYKTTREFLIQFGLNSLSELPTLKEFEELGRLALTDSDQAPAPPGIGEELSNLTAPSSTEGPREEQSSELTEFSMQEPSPAASGDSEGEQVSQTPELQEESHG